MKKTTYSLIIPVYNSSVILPKLVEEVKNNFCNYDYQIIFVNDASRDESWNTLKELKENSGVKMKLISLANNAGQHAALFCGFMHSDTDYIITLDDDLQHHPKEIYKLIEEAQNTDADLVYGIYEQKKHNPLRNAGSILFARLVYSFASTPLHGSSFKLIRKDLAERVVKHSHFNFYLDEVLAWYSKKTAFTKVQHQERTEGYSGYTPKTLIKMSLSIMFNYTAIPLKMITYLGIVSSLVSFGFGIYFIVQKLNNDVQIGFTALIVAIFFSTGLLLLSLGVIGEYISRIFLLENGKPPFKINDFIE